MVIIVFIFHTVVGDVLLFGSVMDVPCVDARWRLLLGGVM